MAYFAVIADDLTGANGTGVLLVENRLKVLSAVNHETLAAINNFQNFHGVVVNTCSRGISQEEAGQRVQSVVRTLLKSGLRYFSKRIDSTIRGNLGAEIEGALSALDPEYVAVVVPAFPDLGRITAGGFQLVNGIPVQLTNAGSDPKTPVHSSLVATEISRQTSLPIGSIHLSTVLETTEILKNRLKEEVDAGKKIIIVDAITDQDIAHIGDAVQAAGIKALSVDPGPFSKEMIMRWTGRKPGSLEGKVMVISGSATALTRAQLDFIQQEQKSGIVNVDVKRLLDSGLNENDELKIANQVFEHSLESRIFGLRVAAEKDMVLDLASIASSQNVTIDELAGRITSTLASIANKVLTLGVRDLKGVYLTGGDMTVDFCRATGAEALELKGEVMPLAACGVVIGGKLAGVKVVTKGGLVGTTESALKCVNYLLNDFE